MQRRTDQPTPPSQSPVPYHQNPPGLPTSPIRFATSTNAFGLATSPASSSSSGHGHNLNPGQGNVETSPLSGVKPRLRRPSMLSLGPPTTFKPTAPDEESDQEEDMGDDAESSRSRQGQAGSSRMFGRTGGNPFEVQPSSRWTSGPGFLSNENRGDSGSAIGLEALSTTTPPIPTTELINDNLSLLDRSPPRWLPGHLGRRKGKARAEDAPDGMPTHPDTHRPPPTGPPLPASLLAALRSETSPLDHEYKSEARLQRLISSHPRAVPFTPRTSRSSRGRFPDEAGDEDDEDDFPSRRALWASRAWTRRSSSDSDSDDMSSMPMDDYGPGSGSGFGANGRGMGSASGGEPVNTAFAAGMDMERIASASEQEGSGKSTPGAGSGSGSVPPNGATTPAGANAGIDKTRPPRMSFSGGLIASPGTGFGLPSAFGGLGMGGGTPIGSPTIERLDLATSPLSNSPSLMQYRESTGGFASHRPGKRKANMDDRFDPYKRPRGSSPALSTSSMGGMLGMSPSRASNIPIPGSAGGLSFGQGLAGAGLAGSVGSTGMGHGSGGNGGIGLSGTYTQGPPSSPMPYNTLPLPHPTSGATAPAIPGSGSNMTNLRQGPGRSGHPYTRPLSSRSRAPSPALSVGSVSGLSTGLSAANRERGLGMGMSTAGGAGGGLGQAFQMSPQGQGQGNMQGQQQQEQHQQGGLGGLGLLSLANRHGQEIQREGQGQGGRAIREMEEETEGQAQQRDEGRNDADADEAMDED